MINKLPNWILTAHSPSFYDTESLTAVEMCAKLHGKMNELIEDYNKFVNDTNVTITNIMNDANADRDVFESSMRQEFQDFIDVADLKIAGIQEELNAAKGVVFNYNDNEEGLMIGE